MIKIAIKTHTHTHRKKIMQWNDKNTQTYLKCIFLSDLCAIMAFNVDWWETFPKLWHGKMIEAALVTLFDLCLPFNVANLSFALAQCAPKQPVLNKTCSIYKLQKYEWILNSTSIFMSHYASEKYRFLILREEGDVITSALCSPLPRTAPTHLNRQIWMLNWVID